MSAVGPQLPSEAHKRKRTRDDDEDNSSSDSSLGPSPPSQRDRNPSPSSAKRSRVIGPTLPPAPLDERPSNPPQQQQADDEDESSDDDFGPSLPSENGAVAPGPKIARSQVSAPPAPAPAQRDEWMTLAPSSGDWSARVDPTKLKNRKFNTGKGAKAPSQASGTGGNSWHETPEEKQARLQREVLGIKDSHAGRTKTGSNSPGNAQDEATARRLKEFNETQRGPSLYASHTSSNKVEEDDPSARAFDREKDIAGGATINATKRRDMVQKATDFSTRFSKASYL